MRELGLKRARFSGGGERTLHPQLRTIIEYLHANGISLSELTTNGLLLDDSLQKLLLQLHWMSVQFSLSASNESDWRKATKGPRGGFTNIISNIKALVRRRRALNSTLPIINVMFGVDRITYSKLTEAYELACDMGVDTVLFSTYNKVVYPKRVLQASDLIVKQLAQIYRTNAKTKRLKHVFFLL